MLTDVVIANKSYTKLNISEDSMLDSVALKVIRQDCPDFLLPVKAMEIDGEMEIRYELLDGIRLSYTPEEMCKKDFIEMLVNMLIPFKICNDWFLDYHNFMLDENYILIGKNGRSVRYVYIPSGEYANSDETIKDFFTGVILKKDIRDDSGYMVNLLRIIKNPASNLLTLLDYLQRETMSAAAQNMDAGASRPAGRQEAGVRHTEEHAGFLDSVKNAIPKPALAEQKNPAVQTETARKQTGAETSPISVARPGHNTGEFGKHDEEGRLIGNLFGESADPVKKKESKKKKDKPAKSGGMFGLFKGKSKEGKEPETQIPHPAPMDGISGGAAKAYQAEAPSPKGRPPLEYRQNQGTPPVFYGDETVIVSEDEINDNCVLRLHLENCTGCNCPEFIEIDLQNGFATIGRLNKNGEAQSDFNFDASVSFVSRRHFRVERSQEQWQIIDLESANGTYLNGTPLLPNMPYPLSKDDLIMICCNKRRLAYRVY